jgi:hypothetical protein
MRLVMISNLGFMEVVFKRQRENLKFIDTKPWYHVDTAMALSKLVVRKQWVLETDDSTGGEELPKALAHNRLPISFISYNTEKPCLPSWSTSVQKGLNNARCRSNSCMFILCANFALKQSTGPIRMVYFDVLVSVITDPSF